MSKHTPGEWKTFDFDGDQIMISSPDELVAVVYAFDRKKEEGEANARLMAASKDLLAACNQAFSEIPFGDKLLTKTANMLAGAIAKADGGSS